MVSSKLKLTIQALSQFPGGRKYKVKYPDVSVLPKLSDL